MTKNKPKIVVFDFETSPQLGWFFGSKWETNIVKIESFETIISVAWMDADEKKVHTIAQWDFKGWKKGVWNDKELCKFFLGIISKYDIIVGQNSDQFDIKVFNTRLAFHGLEPVPQQKTFDTKKLAKNKLHLPSNSLDDMSQFFGIGGKLHHSGLDMWFGCRDGNKKDQAMMKKYNGLDVILTRDVFLKLLPYAKISNDFARLNGTDINCSNPTCGSSNLARIRQRMTASGLKQQYQCRDCYHYTQDSKVIR